MVYYSAIPFSFLPLIYYNNSKFMFKEQTPSESNSTCNIFKSDNPVDAPGAANAVVTVHSIDMPISIRHPRKTRTLIGTLADPPPWPA